MAEYSFRIKVLPHISYVRFANGSHLDLMQLKSGKEKKGIYNIQRINSYHSRLKGFLRPFNGVSTKYLTRCP